MDQRLRNWFKRTFQFEDRIHHERVWKHWTDALTRIDSLTHSFQAVSESYTRLASSLERERETNRRMVMELSIVNVAPLETMDRALDILTAVPLVYRPSESPVGRAIAELESGIKMMRKMRSVKEAEHGNRSSAA